MTTMTKLNKDEQCKYVDIKIYRGMNESLLYLKASMLDIIFSICMCARFHSCPMDSHLIMVKHIIRYLKDTINMGLCYLET